MQPHPTSLPQPESPPRPLSQVAYDNYLQEKKKLGVFSDILVVSRPSRVDRRATMERLRLALGVSWTYIDAVSYDAPVVTTIIDCIKLLRSMTQNESFEWPSTSPGDISGGLADSRLASSSFPCHPAVPGPPIETGWQLPRLVSSIDTPSVEPLTCATENRINGVQFRADLPSYMIMNAGKVACWYSHLAALALIASYEGLTLRSGLHRAFLILEDDIDVDRRLVEKLRAVWPALPRGWDVVYLGHCWSNESYYPAITANQNLGPDGKQVNLHPSSAPKCTHAYALNPRSARRLLEHLTFPPFAYSRALDQAMAWLVQSKRLKAFSLVPSLIVQHKESSSDIEHGSDGTGSGWKEHLDYGVLSL
ncbi:hypothetical protein GY45DRAFT_1257247 [Cubamyces sp. BRFM 1775]|nr:hypothetical protein GY45DRAFT_1257247 [Cubamyces sp. BRFM 1775]